MDDENSVPPLARQFDLERDLKSSAHIRNKLMNSTIYRQNLYAALCNNEFQPLAIWPQLANYTWRCSWRYAGGLVAGIVGEGDYLDYYCSGIMFDETPIDMGYVEESMVTDEIREDLKNLGWRVIE